MAIFFPPRPLKRTADGFSLKGKWYRLSLRFFRADKIPLVKEKESSTVYQVRIDKDVLEAFLAICKFFKAKESETATKAFEIWITRTHLEILNDADFAHFYYEDSRRFDFELEGNLKKHGVDFHVFENKKNPDLPFAIYVTIKSTNLFIRQLLTWTCLSFETFVQEKPAPTKQQQREYRKKFREELEVSAEKRLKRMKEKNGS